MSASIYPRSRDNLSRLVPSPDPDGSPSRISFSVFFWPLPIHRYICTLLHEGIMTSTGKQGRQILFCRGCKVWVVCNEYRGICPRCGEPPAVFKCSRCGHEWTPRKATIVNKTLPSICPKCRSPYWARERTKVSPSGKVSPKEASE